MLSAVRSRTLGRWRPPPHLLSRLLSSPSAVASPEALLELPEVEKVLRDVRAGDVRVFPVGEGGLHGGACADYMVVATGRSDWHVRNIAQALLYKIKQKQKGSDRILMPSVEGQQAGKWVVIDSGSIIIHALEERAREYYDLESIWSREVSPNISVQELETSLAKTRRRNRSQKPMKSI
ncbi:protein Iojap-related, mitochondrial isoform X2 [Phragmites australis]|uniref:protein Iojap-related, mitochondrial isoform X2 n=1 Tax=Phragmites australis TaxID=29695 RepID=UPI002D7855BA|nr:protein Iojap-related, mitochondrial isoform X2 [Phragmites australis]